MNTHRHTHTRRNDPDEPRSEINLHCRKHTTNAQNAIRENSEDFCIVRNGYCMYALWNRTEMLLLSLCMFTHNNLSRMKADREGDKGHASPCCIIVLRLGWEGLGGFMPIDRKSRLMLTLGSDHVAGIAVFPPGFWTPICWGNKGPAKLWPPRV